MPVRPVSMNVKFPVQGRNWATWSDQVGGTKLVPGSTGFGTESVLQILDYFQRQMALPVQGGDNTFWAPWLWHWNRHRSYFAHFQTFRISFMSHFKCMSVICRLIPYLCASSHIRPKTAYCHVIYFYGGKTSHDRVYGDNPINPITHQICFMGNLGNLEIIELDCPNWTFSGS